MGGIKQGADEAIEHPAQAAITDFGANQYPLWHHNVTIFLQFGGVFFPHAVRKN